MTKLKVKHINLKIYLIRSSPLDFYCVCKNIGFKHNTFFSITKNVTYCAVTDSRPKFKIKKIQ